MDVPITIHKLHDNSLRKENGIIIVCHFTLTIISSYLHYLCKTPLMTTCINIKMLLNLLNELVMFRGELFL